MLGFNLQQLLASMPSVSTVIGSNTVHHQYGSGGSAWTAVASSKSCCEALTKSLGKNAVVFPYDAAYSQSMGSYFSLKNSDLSPNCIALPRSSQDVSLAVQTLSLGAHAWEGQCQFGVRGGGHTPFKGAASIDGGIVIDLLHMPTAGISPDHETITVSPSTTWDLVYEALDVHNRSTLGTKVAGVGVGGAATACGVSYFSPRYGYICDMVENWEVVLATGDIVNANQHENADLWKALRGGNNNFGIVTAITLKTFEQGSFWGGQTFHSIDTRKEHFKNHAALASAHPYDPYAHYINTLVLANMTGGHWFIGNSIQYTKSDPPTSEPDVFKPFLETKRTPIFPGAPLDTLRVDNVTSFSREYAASTLYPQRWQFACISFAPDAEFMETFFQMADKAMRQFVSLPGFKLILNYQPAPAIQLERQGAVDSLGPIQTEGNVVFIHWAVSYDQSVAEMDDAITETVQKLFKDANARAKQLGVYRSFIQPTYADSWQSPLEVRSKSTIKEMIATSKKYDPLQVFQKQVPGGFKLPSL
ncbi:putative FAD-binding domain, PCMH-type, FAD-binding, type PCMH, subdomain 2 [Septoria linicola]|nr:putative FAD-binding domain, PCMH-type, FAD-binding, type PCMH, subdomain 2 [Septoria linicola]